MTSLFYIIIFIVYPSIKQYRSIVVKLLKNNIIMPTTILTICPELYSTKVAFSKDENIIYQSEITHIESDFILCENIMDQLPLRRDAIMSQLREDDIDIKSIQYVVAEGGLLRPCKTGVYVIDKKMVSDLIEGIAGDDVINLGGLLAYTIANNLRIQSFVVDPVSVDERSELAAFAPHISLKKKSLFHVMIHKYLSKKYAESIKKNYEDLNLIFCHVSERSVSVAAHKKGEIVDVNQEFMGCGPMGFFETGTLPSSDIVDMIFKKCYSKNEILNLINKGSANSYLGITSFDKISDAFKDNNKKVKIFLEAMAYQIAKEIASHYVSLDGEIDAIILSGKIFSLNRFFKYISKRIKDLAPIVSYPDDLTNEAMIFNVLQLLNGETQLKNYN